MIIKERQKEVMYLGVKLFVPDEEGFLTTDRSGQVLFSTGDVQRSEHYEGWELVYNFDDRQFKICTVHLDGMDWKDTLMEVA